MNSKPTVTVIGRGNVGTQFARIFDTEPISSRSLEGLPTDSDLYIISVSDSAVGEVASRLGEVEGIVAHTTGSVALDILKNVRSKGYGVIYPFQTISRNRILEAESIPLLIEGDSRETLSEIRSIAGQFGFTHIDETDSDKRRRVHLCGVFACNFTNAMIGISQKILSDCGISGSIIAPLVEETTEKLKSLTAREAQTGPAIRKDIATMTKHMDLLNELGLEEESKIYMDISEYIMSDSMKKTDD